MRWRLLIQALLLLSSTGVPGPFHEFFKLSFISDSRSEESSIASEAKELESSHSWEQELFVLINKYRIENNLPPLVIDESLMRIAREHSVEMAKQELISHDQPSGDLQVRMNHAGYFFEAARENIARVRSINKAHSGFINSAIHRENILARDVTHIGIGVVRNPYPFNEYLVITEIFATPGKSYPASTIQNTLLNQIKKLKLQGAVAVEPDPLLDKIASRSLVSLNVPYNREELRGILSESAGELIEAGKIDLSKLEVVVQLIRNPREIAFPSSRRQGQALLYGSAVRQIKDSRNQPAFLVMTLLSVSR
jgi:uncharacterized protein YkwD